MIWWQDPLTNTWSLGKLIPWGRGFAIISPGESLEPVWIPACRVKQQKQPMTPGNLIMAIFALITITMSIPLTLAEAKNYTYWDYVPNPLLLRPFNWGEGSIPVYVNDDS